MFIAWAPDRTDFQYQRQQFELKKLELNYDLKEKWSALWVDNINEVFMGFSNYPFKYLLYAFYRNANDIK